MRLPAWCLAVAVATAPAAAQDLGIRLVSPAEVASFVAGTTACTPQLVGLWIVPQTMAAWYCDSSTPSAPVWRYNVPGAPSAPLILTGTSDAVQLQVYGHIVQNSAVACIYSQAGDPLFCVAGGNDRGIYMLDDATDCSDPPSGATTICSVGSKVSFRAPGAATRPLLYILNAASEPTCSQGYLWVRDKGAGLGEELLMGLESSDDVSCVWTPLVEAQ